MSRVAGAGSSGWFFISVGRCGTGAEAEAVIASLKDVAPIDRKHPPEAVCRG